MMINHNWLDLICYDMIPSPTATQLLSPNMCHRVVSVSEATKKWMNAVLRSFDCFSMESNTNRSIFAFHLLLAINKIAVPCRFGSMFDTSLFSFVPQTRRKCC